MLQFLCPVINCHIYQQNSFEHPKLLKLQELLITHFLLAEENGEDTRVIIFTEVRARIFYICTLIFIFVS